MHSESKYTIATLIACILFFLSPGFAEAETLYVCDASREYGSEDGSSVADCFDGGNDILWSTIDETSGAVDPGDTLCVVGIHELTSAINRIAPKVSGRLGAKITIKGDCDGVDRGVIDGAGAVTSLVALTNLDFIVVDGLTLKNSGPAGHAINAYAHNGTSALHDEHRSIDIVNNTLTDCFFTCVFAYGAGFVISDNYVAGCGSDCVFVSGGRDLKFTSNVVLDASNIENDGDSFQLANAGIDYSGDIVVKNNYCDHTSANYKYCFLVVIGRSIAGTLDFSGNIGLGAAGGGDHTNHVFRIDCSNPAVDHQILISGNLALNGERGIEIQNCSSQNGLVINNVVNGAADEGIYLHESSDQIDIWFNTIVNVGDAAISINKVEENRSVIQNNLLLGNKVGLFSVSEPIHENNRYWDNEADFAGWQSVSK